MAETKSRRETPATQTRVRPKGEMPSNTDKAIDENMASSAPSAPAAEAVATQTLEVPQRNGQASRSGIGFDEEVNTRYEEIKRGSTHISELQQMTMPQLLKIAKEEKLTDYTGLKKQDLIFRILKERVKQNGLANSAAEGERALLCAPARGGNQLSGPGNTDPKGRLR